MFSGLVISATPCGPELSSALSLCGDKCSPKKSYAEGHLFHCSSHSQILLHWTEYVPLHPCSSPHSIFTSWTGKRNFVWNNSLCKHNAVKLSRWDHLGVSLGAFTPKSRKVCIRNQREGNTEEKAMPCEEGQTGVTKTQESWLHLEDKQHGKFL